MSAARRFSVDERRSRLARRHALVGGAPSVEAAAEAMVVLHATDPASVYLSALARLAEPSIAAVEQALYDDRSVVRVLAMRRTLFVVPVRYLEVIERSSTPEVAAQMRKRLEAALADSGIADPSRWLADAQREVEELLPDDGAQARALTPLSPALATKIVMGRGTKNEIEVGATSRVLGLLAVEGRLMRGRPAGDWTGRQYEWHRRERWLHSSTGSAPDASSVGTDELDEVGAATKLIERWLRSFGPAVFDDLKWWTGWRVREVRAALAGLDVEEIDLDGAPGIALTDDLDAVEPVEPWAALLPALDPTPMGWKERAWYLGPHKERLFDRNGNVGPTIWVDGRIVGGWGQRPDGKIETRLLEDVGSDRQDLIEERSAQLQALIGDTVVRPSFPTPLQREIYQYSS